MYELSHLMSLNASIDESMIFYSQIQISVQNRSLDGRMFVLPRSIEDRAYQFPRNAHCTNVQMGLEGFGTQLICTPYPPLLWDLACSCQLVASHPLVDPWQLDLSPL